MVQNSKRGKELNQFCPPKSSDDLCLSICLYSSSMKCCIIYSMCMLHVLYTTYIGLTNEAKGILCLRLRTAYSGFRYSLLAHTYIFLSCKSSHEQRNLGRKKRKREKKIIRIKRDTGKKG